MSERVFEDTEGDGDQDVYEDDVALAPAVKVVPHVPLGR